MSILRFENVHKSFGEGTRATPVLNGIDLEVAEGEFLVILGFSGTGKTTLINLMAGLEQPTRGKVKRQRRSHITFRWWASPTPRRAARQNFRAGCASG